MNNKFKLLPLAIAGCILAAPVVAAEKANANEGTVSAQLKVMEVVGAANNGFDPSEGSAYLLKLKYETASWNGAKVGLGFYNNGDFFNRTDFDAAATDPDKKLARGMFVDDEGQETSQMGEFYLKYDIENFGLSAGRQIYDTPLTNITYSTTPTFYTVYGVNTTAVPGLKLSMDLVTQMSFGARTATDWGLIGEGTRTAGVTINPTALDGENVQAQFLDISVAATGDKTSDTDGITVFGASYTGVKGLTLSAWDYYADDISNTIYLDGSYGLGLGGGVKMKFFAQYLSQNEEGSLIEDNHMSGFTDGIDFSLFGLKGVVSWKGLMGFLAYNKSSGDTGMFNSWGGDPAYTSSIFSRNAYRENVSAYKIGVKYNILKNLFVMLSHADYGQSDTTLSNGSIEAVTDAKETDFVIVYKPTKASMIKLFHANRTSEYDGFSPTAERTQAHTRIVLSYDF